METLRTLPIRVAPLPGEALDSWLEALARRLRTPLGEVTRSIGLPRKGTGPTRLRRVPRSWTILLDAEQAAALSLTTGVTDARLHAMTLRRYDQRALMIVEDRFVNRMVLWGRAAGSRFCPDCLMETGGRWQLSWRLGWSFACVRHHRLLADSCPQCGRVPRQRSHSLRSIPTPHRCGNAPSRPDSPFTSGCGFDLTQVQTTDLPTGHAVLAAQTRLSEIIESGTAAFGPYALAPQPTSAALSDIRAICGRVLSSLSAEDLAEWAPTDIASAHSHPAPNCTLAARAGNRPGFMAPPRAVSTAAAVTSALQILDQPDVHRAGHMMRIFLETIYTDISKASNHKVADWGRDMSDVLKGVHLAALAPFHRPGDYLRYRISSPLPGAPTAASQDITARSRKIPSTFWKSWSIRLLPPTRLSPRLAAPVLAVALLVVDSRTGFGAAADMLGTLTDRSSTSRILGLLRDEPEWPGLSSALVRLADYLDTTEVPVDYGRRRTLDYTGLLPTARWRDICRWTGTPPGQGRREQIIRCHLFQRISGLPPEAAPDAMNFKDYSGLRMYIADTLAALSPQLAHALDEEAKRFLGEWDIHGEPVTWHPPTTLLTGHDLPGPDPDHVDISRLHAVVRSGESSPRRIAAMFDTTVETVRHLLDEHPAPLLPLPPSQARRGRHDVLALQPSETGQQAPAEMDTTVKRGPVDT
ncbi:TniQ family protein [Streptomyces sp. NPDC051453]|uniref:TniQ family protein n=1 Tax=Streptomyces sp. NPDC051453 TaxID=3154941 RepID=UPI003448B51F